MSSSVIVLKKSPLRVLSGFARTESGYMPPPQKHELRGVLRFHEIEGQKLRNAARMKEASEKLMASGKHLLSVKVARCS